MKNRYYVIVLGRDKKILAEEGVLGFKESNEYAKSIEGGRYFGLFKDAPISSACVRINEEWVPITTARFLQIVRNNNGESDRLGAPRWLSRDRADSGALD